MPGGAVGGQLVTAAQGALDAFRDAVGNAGQPIQVDIRDFDHGGFKVRGLASTIDVPAGQIISSVGRNEIVSSDDLTDPRFDGAANDVAKVGLWLSEKKAELIDAPAQHLSPEDERLAAWLRAYPTLAEVRSTGGAPLVAPDAVLAKWARLPRVDYSPGYDAAVKARLVNDIANYNEHRGAHPKMDYENALWGRAMANSRDFSCRGAALAPVVDLFNHAGSKSNVHWWCDTYGKLNFAARKRIKAGEELTIDYGEKDAASMAGVYGFVDPDRVDQWPAEDCEEVHAAGIGVGQLRPDASGSEKVMEQLVTASCSSASAAAAPDSSPPPAPDVKAAALPALAAQASVPLPLFLASCLGAPRPKQRALGGNGAAGARAACTRSCPKRASDFM
eukprot:TRINITY_DN12097_c0_g1_i2.p1 TRINITY_DN12097_c0_g1~~TRINITY_DN12097_c0_g1_i2.p1  ORF type:complete len:390 (-),score=73.66 TRINITY_DN12097_c0_g1_i2:177-1346(-)